MTGTFGKSKMGLASTTSGSWREQHSAKTTTAASSWPDVQSGTANTSGSMDMLGCSLSKMESISGRGRGVQRLPQLARPKLAVGFSVLNCETCQQAGFPSDTFPVSQSVAVVKQFIAREVGMPAAEMQLFWKGMPLEGSRTLTSYGVTAGDLLCASRSSADDGGLSSLPRHRRPGAVAGEGRAAVGAAGSTMRNPSTFFDWKGRPEYGSSSMAKEKAPLQLFLLDAVTGSKIRVPPSIHLRQQVHLVKEVISSIVRIPPSHMQLSWSGQILKNSKTLVSYGIQSGQCLHVKRLQGNGDGPKTIQITVHCLDSCSRPTPIDDIQLTARCSDCVFQLKDRIEDMTGVLAGDQRLFLAGRTLSNCFTLSSCGIADNIILHLARPFATPMPSHLLERNSKLARGFGSMCIESTELTLIVREVWPQGRRFHIGVTPDVPLRGLKEKIAVLRGVPRESQMLIHIGRELQDDFTANYYNLEAGDHLELVMVGGAPKVKDQGGISRPVFATAPPPLHDDEASPESPLSPPSPVAPPPRPEWAKAPFGRKSFRQQAQRAESEAQQQPTAAKDEVTVSEEAKVARAWVCDLTDRVAVPFLARELCADAAQRAIASLASFAAGVWCARLTEDVLARTERGTAPFLLMTEVNVDVGTFNLGHHVGSDAENERASFSADVAQQSGPSTPRCDVDKV
eukprot:CAMPEP_0204210224 /NCGR_PEP_ID=MMETSP0361-20130328/73769_1 /ASSEMBLY_ACC=CAM_ASM_000343 /TAXON_ID=268821 /ORGANISM="Scrippsiella Hangoei, Strain SHTV-5" /LENGTH=682 /DNA_ID=CAMNT_0051174317 /DNA_START=29 /DNA_END=2077 /DNA_ORIENTATION=-